MSDTTKKLTDYQILVFDVYGTIVDWETGIYEGLKPMLSKYPESLKWTRKQVLDAYTAVEKELQANYPHMLYCDILAKVYEAMEQGLKTASEKPTETRESDTAVSDGLSPSASTSAPSVSDDHVRFGQSIKDWPIFPDSTAALRALSKQYKLVVLSNVDRTSFARTLAKLSDSDSPYSPEVYSPPESTEYWFPQRTPASKSPFTLVLTAQDVQSYKPALHGFEVALDVIRKEPALLNVAKEQVLWVAQSLFHDIAPVSQIGITNAHMGFTTPEPPYCWRFNTLGEMADAVAKEQFADVIVS
ncbi:HAD-like domain-containing protein [Rhodocollybia butyracea]|uniref:HAD-like domain-containing protein n=1 Tax=Rhodocollybia butyracea TaxID=206335 RepID=A0A9P5PNU9_9AGAR|nr:HAD-like domain-containing protein [Rhodocollybia butyracea]